MRYEMTTRQVISEEVRLSAVSAYEVGERYGFNSPQHERAYNVFKDIQKEYEQYCAENNVPAYMYYNED